ncbi:ANKRD2 [Symbiodinium sp. KB8]|nr:ANKRD2 [Symbiodinium sp. KB8]
MSRDDKVSADISWAMTGAPIGTFILDPGTTVSELKAMLEVPAKTPWEYLELLCDGVVLRGSDCVLHTFARSPDVDLSVMRKEPPRLVDFLKQSREQEFNAWPTCQKKDLMATERRDVRVAKYIMEADRDGSQVNSKDTRWDAFLDFYGGTYNRCTALHYAAAWGQTRICKMLLDLSAFRVADAVADVAMPDSVFYTYVLDHCVQSCTALHSAIACGSWDTCRLLLNHSRFTAVAAANAAGQTALHLGVLEGNPLIVEELLADGRVDINAHTRHGQTALDMALMIRREFPWRSRATYERILVLLLEGGRGPSGHEAFRNVLEEAVVNGDKRLLHVALRCRHGMDKFLAGLVAHKDPVITEFLFSERATAKEVHSRRRELQKQRACRRRQNASTKAHREQVVNAASPVQIPKRSYRSKSRCSWKQTEFDFTFC